MQLSFLSPSGEGTNPKPLDVIYDLLQSQNPQFEVAVFISAFCNDAGVIRLVRPIHEFQQNGGRALFYLGIDHQGTTVEGLQRILSIADEAFIFHNARGGATFHPKMYVFEKHNDQVSVILGSSNLTLGGLYTNYEANIRIDFQLPEDADKLQEARQLWQGILDAPDRVLRPLSHDLIRTLQLRGQILSERVLRRTRAASETQQQHTRAQSGTEIPENPFSSIRVPLPPPVDGELLARPTRQRPTPQTQSELIDTELHPQVRSFLLMLNPIDRPRIPGEIRVPLRAIYSNPYFWHYPENYNLIERDGSEYWEWYPVWRITSHHVNPPQIVVERVRMYHYPRRSEFRLYTGTFQNVGGSGGDILRLN